MYQDITHQTNYESDIQRIPTTSYTANTNLGSIKAHKKI